MEQRLQLQTRQLQRLIMTPKMQQSIHLLQLSTLELTNLLQKELVENPLLEEAPSMEAEAEAEAPDATQSDNGSDSTSETHAEYLTNGQIEFDSNWEEYFADSSSAREDFIPQGGVSEPSTETTEMPLAYSETLKEHLKWQLEVSPSNEMQKAIGNLIIENLNKDGYLEISVDQIAEMTGTEISEVEKVLTTVQSFEPVGIAARDLSECLQIQYHFYELDDPLILEIITYHMADLERKRYTKLAKVLGVSEKRVQDIADQIGHMEPKPGRKYSTVENEYVSPDVFVEKVDGEYRVRVNDEGTPPLRISRRYRRMLHEGELSEEALEFIKNKYKSAMWLIRNIEQRKRTLYNVTSKIVEMQGGFFDNGITHLKPMRLKDVADEVGVHEATVCRVVNGKYVQTPRGLFELKFFFSSGLGSDVGEDQSSKSVMEALRCIIEEEDPKKPYSDQKIADILKARGIRIARRTVSKYREKMGILPTSTRKRV
jgi:RNA polymerase sigma-54 factor